MALARATHLVRTVFLCYTDITAKMLHYISIARIAQLAERCAETCID